MVVKTDICRFSGLKIYPGRTTKYFRSDATCFIFLGGKNRSLYNQRKKPSKIAWTFAFRKAHRKDQVLSVGRHLLHLPRGQEPVPVQPAQEALQDRVDLRVPEGAPQGPGVGRRAPPPREGQGGRRAVLHRGGLNGGHSEEAGGEARAEAGRPGRGAAGDQGPREEGQGRQ